MNLHERLNLSLSLLPGPARGFAHLISVALVFVSTGTIGCQMGIVDRGVYDCQQAHLRYLTSYLRRETGVVARMY